LAHILFCEKYLPLETSFPGGTNGHGNILDVTRGHFKSSFVGCIKNVIVQVTILPKVTNICNYK
jgi:hypothetical protein